MKTINLKSTVTLLLLIFAFSALSAQNSRHSRNDRNRDREGKAVVMEATTEQPCMRYDTDEYYAASGWARIKAGGDGERDQTLQINKLLGSTRQQLKQKIGGRYQAVVHDYFEQMDIDAKSSAASRITSAGEMIIDRMLNDMEEDCRQFGEIDEAGYRNVYIGILVLKTELVDKLINGMQQSKTLSSDEKEKLRENESKFRESAFKVFDQDKK